MKEQKGPDINMSGPGRLFCRELRKAAACIAGVSPAKAAAAAHAKDKSSVEEV
jgi:hypothetical protein